MKYSAFVSWVTGGKRQTVNHDRCDHVVSNLAQYMSASVYFVA